MSFICFHPQCNRGPTTTGSSVFRINVKGQPGIWACEEHRKNTDAPNDPELNEIVKILEEGS
jgi:hypothetical protein